jgi:hypothetical protein
MKKLVFAALFVALLSGCLGSGKLSEKECIHRLETYYKNWECYVPTRPEYNVLQKGIHLGSKENAAKLAENIKLRDAYIEKLQGSIDCYEINISDLQEND